MFCRAALLLFAASASYGQTEEPSGLEAQLGMEIRHDDNIFRTAESLHSSIISIVSPRLKLTATPSKHRFVFQYDGEIAWYDESHADDYDDHFLEAGAYLALGRKISFDIIGSFDAGHENRGAGLTEGFDPTINIPAEPDRFERAEILGRFGIGSNTTAGRLVLDAGYRDLEYTNNLDRTRFFDRDETYGGAIFYYRLMPQTSLFLDARYTDIHYQIDRILQPSLDSEEYRYLIGITWDTTAKTKGTVKVGYVDKKFADSARGDFSDPTWEVDVRWSPRSYSHFDFQASRAPTETNGQGSFIDKTEYSVTWEHRWRQNISSQVGGRYVDQEYRDLSTARVQELTQYSFFLSYQMRRWLEWKAGVEVNSRDSNINRFQFDGNIYSISATLTR